MKTESEIAAQIYAVERDLKVMGETPAKMAWEYYVKALKWVLGGELKLIWSFEIPDEKTSPEVGPKQGMRQGH